MLKTAPIQIRNNARGDENVQAEAPIIGFFSWNTSHVQQITAKNGRTHVIYNGGYAKAKLITFLFMHCREAAYLWQQGGQEQLTRVIPLFL